MTPVPRDCLPIWARGTGARRRVTWFPLRNLETPEPFFGQTLTRLSNAEEEVTTGAEALRAFAGIKIDIPVTFIFHVSHCGSTLLANALKTLDGALVLAEPPLLRMGQLLQPPLDEGLLRGAIRAFAANGPAKRYLFIKVMNMGSLFLPEFRRLFPEANFIFLYRDPQAIIGSKLVEVSEEKRLASVPVMRGLLRKPASWNPEPVQFWSEVFKAQSMAALTASGVRRIDYRDLNARTVLEILPNLGVDGEHVDAAALEAAFGRYSKDPSGQRAFVSSADSAAQRGAGLLPHQYEAARRAYAGLLSSAGTTCSGPSVSFST